MTDRPTETPGADAVAATIAAHNKAMITITLLTAAALFVGASFYPAPLVMPALSGLLTLSAAVCIAIALFRRHLPGAPYLTFWDKGAVLLLLGLGAAMLTDVQAVQTYVESLQSGAAQTPSKS